MPAKSKSQQRFMGMVHAVQKGELSPSKVSDKVKDVADNMSDKDAEDFASTKHKGKPEKVTESSAEKKKILALMIKRGDNPKDAQKSIDKVYDYIKKAYRKAPPHKKAEIISSLAKYENVKEKIREMVRPIIKESYASMFGEFTKDMKSSYEVQAAKELADEYDIGKVLYVFRTNPRAFIQAIKEKMKEMKTFNKAKKLKEGKRATKGFQKAFKTRKAFLEAMSDFRKKLGDMGTDPKIFKLEGELYKFEVEFQKKSAKLFDFMNKLSKSPITEAYEMSPAEKKNLKSAIKLYKLNWRKKQSIEASVFSIANALKKGRFTKSAKEILNTFKQFDKAMDNVLGQHESISKFNEAKALKFTHIKDRTLEKHLKLVTKKVGAELKKISGGFKVSGDMRALTAVVDYVFDKSIKKGVMKGGGMSQINLVNESARMSDRDLVKYAMYIRKYKPSLWKIMKKSPDIKKLVRKFKLESIQENSKDAVKDMIKRRIVKRGQSEKVRVKAIKKWIDKYSDEYKKGAYPDPWKRRLKLGYGGKVQDWWGDTMHIASKMLREDSVVERIIKIKRDPHKGVRNTAKGKKFNPLLLKGEDKIRALVWSGSHPKGKGSYELKGNKLNVMGLNPRDKGFYVSHFTKNTGIRRGNLYYDGVHWQGKKKF